MRKRDLIGRKIVGVEQFPLPVEPGTSRGYLRGVQVLLHLDLDNGKRIIFEAVETETDPVVSGKVVRPLK